MSSFFPLAQGGRPRRELSPLQYSLLMNAGLFRVTFGVQTPSPSFSLLIASPHWRFLGNVSRRPVHPLTGRPG